MGCDVSQFFFLRSACAKALLCALAFAVPISHAAEHKFSLLLDTDNAAVTGCVITTADGSVSGVERVNTAVVTTTTTTATVTRLEQQTCVGGALTAATTYDAGGWSAGLGNGTNGSAAIEFSVPLSSLAGGGTVKALAVSRNALGQQDATGSFLINVANAVAAVDVLPVPLSKGLAALIALLVAVTVALRLRRQASTRLISFVFVSVVISTLAWAATVARDGNIGDWIGVSPAVTDASGDAPANADILAAYQQQDANNLYVRIDADVRLDAPVNLAPVVSAGVNQTITLPATASLTGSATDDGLPNPPGVMTLAWSKVSGPGAVTFANAALAATTATFAGAGTYVLKLTADDGALSSSANMTITVSAASAVNQPPVVSAGPNQTIVFPATANLSGSATDDGLPNPPAALTYAWTKFSGPGTVTFAAATSAVTTATFGVAGSYVLRLTANDSVLTSSADVTIAVNTPSNTAPVVSAGPNQTITLPGVATMAGTATDDGLPNPPAALTYEWTLVSGPINGVVFANVAALNTTVTFPAAGTYVLKLTASDSILSTSSTVEIIVQDSGPKLVAIADRTIPVGVRFQQVLAANDANSSDTLAFSLTAAPTGAVLNPSPVVDWTPGNAQLGAHTFGARVTDAQGHTDDGTFKITVVAQNRAPQLAAQAEASIPQGAVFSRTMVATDPDGDAITFAVSSAPPGVTISGANVTWPTTGVAVGDYTITVKASDPAGLFDAKRFTVKVTPSAAPVAVDDTYSTRLGQTLTVPAPGVLGNDFSPSGGSISAIKLTDPDKGTLSAFNANGGFTYQAPATPPGSVFTPVLRHNKDLVQSAFGPTIMIDLDGDGKPELVTYSPNHDIYAIHADTGLDLWRYSGSFFTGCTPYSGVLTFAAADIDDDGKPEVIFSGSCGGDNGSMRLVALNGQNGTIKWISPALAAIPVLGDAASLTSFAVPTIARLRTGESPSVLINVQYAGLHRYAISGFDAFYEPACRLIVETVPDGDYQPNPAFPAHYQQCRGVIVLNGTDGTVRQRMIARKTPISGLDGGTEQSGLSAPVVVDLDGDGTPEIVSGGVVFNLNGTPRWHGASANILEVAVGNFDDTPDIEVVRFETQPSGYFLTVYKSDGAVLWRLPFDFVTFIGKIVVGDLDGDGKADVVFNYGGLLCAIKHDGTYRWCNYEVVSGVSLVSSRTRVAIFDFDGDGVAEVVLQTSQAILFLDGLSGKVKASFAITQASTGSIDPPDGPAPSYHPNAPLVGDVDGDGHADLIFLWTRNGSAHGDISARAALTVLKGQNNDWRPARGVQNQFAYHVANINDDGTIPNAVPLPNNFAVPRTNVFGTQAQTLTPVDPRKFAQTSFTYKANDSTLDSAAATVTIDIAPVNRPPIFDTTPPTRYFQTYQPFSYSAHATDPDAGDTVTYRMVFYNYNGATCSIGATSGVLSCDVPINQPTAFFLIAATDSFGAESLQSVQMTGVTTNSTVPNVTGQTQAAAGTTLTTAGLTVGVVTLATNPAPAGQVIAQVPAAGATSLSGEAVALNISSGPAPVFVPLLVGVAEPVALSLLSASGFSSTITRTFSLTVPRGRVLAQTPVAGTLLKPVVANPVSLVISAGTGLDLKLATSAVNAGESIALIPLAFDASGNSVTLPALSYTITRRFALGLGALPSVSGAAIITDPGALGGFTITANDAANGRTASADFVVLAPRPAGVGGNSAVIADMFKVLDDLEAIGRQLRTARAANDVPQMTALVTQWVNRWRTVDVARLKLTVPIAPPTGFVPEESQMIAYGLSATADDMLIQQVLRDGSDDLQAWTAGLRAPHTSIHDLNLLADRFSINATRINGLVISEYGGVMNNAEMIQLISHDIPEFYEALSDELAVVVGLPRRSSPLSNFKSARTTPGEGQKSTLAEVLVTMATDMIIDKIIESAESAYKNAKKLATDTMGYAGYSAAALAVNAHLKQYLNSDDLLPVVSGASLSFRVFNSPNSFIEIPTSSRRPYLFSTIVIGPTLITDALTGVQTLVTKIKSAMSYGKNAVTNPDAVKNSDDLFKIYDDLKTKVEDIIKTGSALQQKISSRLFQTAPSMINSCIFTAEAPCRELLYPDGFASVYEYKPPPGFENTLVGIPVPILFIVQDYVTGKMYTGLVPFMPSLPPE